MLDTLFLISIVGTVAELIKDACTKPIPAENWANMELYYNDMANGISTQQLLKNVENGKYKMEKKFYPEPHKCPISGKIVIENSSLYNEDIKAYGAHQASKWVEQGRYNLTQDTLKKEHERLREKYDYMYELNRKCK